MSFLIGNTSILPIFARSAVDYEKCIENKKTISLRVMVITAVALTAIACLTPILANPVPLILLAVFPLAVTGYELWRSWYFTNTAAVEQYMNASTNVSTWVLARIGNTKSTAVRLLEQKEFVPEKKDSQGFTALHWCTDPEIAERLLNKAHNPNCKSASGITPLQLLIDIQIAQEDQQAKKPGDPDIAIPEHATPLHLAQRPAVVMKLIDEMNKNKISCNGPLAHDLLTMKKGETPLLAAMKRGYTNQWSQLIEKLLYADPGFPDEYQNEIDKIIADGLKEEGDKRKGFEDLQEALLDFKAFKKYMTATVVSSSALARIGNKPKAVERILDQKETPVDKTDSRGRTALHWCTDPVVAKKLIGKGLNPMLQDADGMTPLQSLLITQVYQEENPVNNIPESKEIISSENHPPDPEEIIPSENNPTEPEEIIPPENNPTEPEEIIPPENNPTEPEEIIPSENNPTEPEEIIPPENKPTEPEEIIPPGNNPPEPKQIIPPETVPLSQSNKIGVILELIQHLKPEQFNAPFPKNPSVIAEGITPFVLALQKGYVDGWKQIIDAMLKKDKNIYLSGQESFDNWLNESIEDDPDNIRCLRELQIKFSKIRP